MASENQNTTQGSGNNSNWNTRNLIAGGITLVTLLATIFVAVKAMCLGLKEGLDFVGKSLLPLWGTWIGTILAFYFSRENFEAASKSYQNVIKSLSPEEKMASIKVIDVMIPYDRIVFLSYPQDKTKKLMEEILKDGRFQAYNRYAVFKDDRSVFKMIHRSMIDRFISEKLSQGKTPDEIKQLTLEDILTTDIAEIKNTLDNSYKLIYSKATLFEAKQAMDEKKECLDVFVTENGKKGEAVLGLITNNLILEKIKG